MCRGEGARGAQEGVRVSVRGAAGAGVHACAWPGCAGRRGGAGAGLGGCMGGARVCVKGSARVCVGLCVCKLRVQAACVCTELCVCLQRAVCASSVCMCGAACVQAARVCTELCVQAACVCASSVCIHRAVCVHAACVQAAFVCRELCVCKQHACACSGLALHWCACKVCVCGTRAHVCQGPAVRVRSLVCVRRVQGCERAWAQGHGCVHAAGGCRGAWRGGHTAPRSPLGSLRAGGHWPIFRVLLGWRGGHTQLIPNRRDSGRAPTHWGLLGPPAAGTVQGSGCVLQPPSASAAGARGELIYGCSFQALPEFAPLCKAKSRPPRLGSRGCSPRCL